MGLWRSMGGTVHVEIISADIGLTLTQINNTGIVLTHITYINALTACADIPEKEFGTFRKWAENKGVQVKKIRNDGLLLSLRSLLKRPVLCIGMAILLVLACWLPGRILFVRVEGNAAIPTKFILEQAELCGIRLGAVRRDVRSEKMKNALLSAIPQLQWAGVNTSGCVANITVREKSIHDEQVQEQTGIAGIVAARDGVILDCTVLRGNKLCQVGQAVKEGQLLVSGYTDTGLSVKATRAKAEIYAQTLHELEVITPKAAAIRGAKSREIKKYGLLIGKKLINFSKDSGISDAGCVKMYSEEYLKLPGGFQLPVGVFCETLIVYDAAEQVPTDAEQYSWLESAAAEYLHTQMIAGKILNTDTQLSANTESCSIRGRYACTEMIGKEKNEEIWQQDGENN